MEQKFLVGLTTAVGSIDAAFWRRLGCPGLQRQIAKAIGENPAIAYVIPREGCTIFVDNMCLTRNSQNKELAHEFMNFVLEATIAADIANGTGYSSVNLAGKALIRPDLLTNEAAYPPREAVERCEFIREIGPAVSVYDRWWTEIKSR
jgi:spermidine/putrescine transport system substrate-binding protein